MRRIGFVVVVLAALSGCGLGSLEIEVKEDGSGKVGFLSMDFDAAKLPLPAGVKGVSKSESFRFAVSGDELSFADVRKLKVPGLDLKWNARPGKPASMTVTLDTRASAMWFKRLGITPERLQEARTRARRFYETVLKDAGLPGLGGGDSEKVIGQLGSMVNVTVKLAKGGKVGATLIKPAKLPAGWELNESEPGKVSFSIPAEDLLANKVQSLTFSVAARAPAAARP